MGSNYQEAYTRAKYGARARDRGALNRIWELLQIAFQNPFKRNKTEATENDIRWMSNLWRQLTPEEGTPSDFIKWANKMYPDYELNEPMVEMYFQEEQGRKKRPIQ